jgi:nitroreductase
MAHMALLAATALGVDTFQTAAFEDSHVASVLQTTRLEEGPGYVLTFGQEENL